MVKMEVPLPHHIEAASKLPLGAAGSVPPPISKHHAKMIDSVNDLYNERIKPSTIPLDHVVPVPMQQYDFIAKKAAKSSSKLRRVASLGRELRSLTPKELHEVRNVTTEHLYDQAGGAPSKLLRTTIGQLERLQGGLMQLEAAHGQQSNLLAFAQASEAAEALGSLLPQMGVDQLSTKKQAGQGTARSPTRGLAPSASMPSSLGAIQGSLLQTRKAAPSRPPSLPSLPGTPSLPTRPRGPTATLASYSSASHLVFSHKSGNTGEDDMRVAERDTLTPPSSPSRPIFSVLDGISAPRVLEMLDTARTEAHLVSLVLGPLADAIRDAATPPVTIVHLLLCPTGDPERLSPQGEAQWLPPIPIGTGLIGLALRTRCALSCGNAHHEAEYSQLHEAPFFNHASVLLLPLLPPAPAARDEPTSRPLGVMALVGPPHTLTKTPQDLMDTLQTVASIVSLTLVRLRTAAELHTLQQARKLQMSRAAGGTSAERPKLWHTAAPTMSPPPVATEALLLLMSYASFAPLDDILNHAHEVPISLVASEAASQGDPAAAIALVWAEQLLPVLAAHFRCESAIFLRFESKRLTLCAGDDPRAEGSVRMALPSKAGGASAHPGTPEAKLAAKQSTNPALIAACTLSVAFTPEAIAAPFLDADGELVGVWLLSGRLTTRIGPLPPKNAVPTAPYDEVEAQQLLAASNALHHKLVEEVQRQMEASPHPAEQSISEDGVDSDSWAGKQLRLLNALLALDDPSSDGGASLALSFAAYSQAVLRCQAALLRHVGPGERRSAYDPGTWGWDATGRRVLVQQALYEPRGLAVLVTQTNESITISAPSRLPSFGSASDIPPLAEPSDIDGVVVLPLASRPGGSCVAQLTRLYQERLLDSPPTAAAKYSAEAFVNSAAAAHATAAHLMIAQRNKAEAEGEPPPPLPPPQMELPPPPPPLYRPPLSACLQVLEGMAPTIDASMQRAWRINPRPNMQLLTLQNALAFQLCVARHGAMSTAALAGAPTVQDVAQAGLDAVIGTATRMMRGLLNASGARLLVHHNEMLRSTPRGAVVGRDGGHGDEMIRESLFLRPIAPTQPGIAVAAAYYRAPVRWHSEMDLSKLPFPESPCDGLPGGSGDAEWDPITSLAVPLLLADGEVVAVVALSNKIRSIDPPVSRRHTPSTPTRSKRTLSGGGLGGSLSGTTPPMNSTADSPRARIAEVPSVAENLMARLPPTMAASNSWPTAPWLEAGLREAGWLEEPRQALHRPHEEINQDHVVPFADIDVELATALAADVTLAMVHADLDAAVATAREQMDSHGTQNLLRERVQRVLSCAADAALLARRACRVAAYILQAESVLFFRFDPRTYTLWRCASSTSDELPLRSVSLNLRAPRSIAAAVATSGDLHATDAPHEDPALLPGFDAPESFELENVLAVPMRAKHTGHAFGVLQALNRRHAGAEVAVGAADAPMRYATARQHTGLDLSGAIDDGRAAVAIDSVAADARKLAEWERAALQMVADEAAAALEMIACREEEDEEEPADEAEAKRVEALCGAERRLAAAEVKVGLIRVAMGV